MKMKDLPITFRDFVIYFVPGILFISYSVIICISFGILKYADIDFIKNQTLHVLLIVIVSYIMGMIINVNIFKLILKKSTIVRNNSNVLERGFNKIILNVESNRYKTLKSFMKDINYSQKMITTNLLWLMVRGIEIRGTHFQIERVNSLRNFSKQLIFVFLYSYFIIFFSFVYFLIVKGLSLHSVKLFLLFITVSTVCTYLSYQKYKLNTTWFINLVLDSYYMNFYYKNHHEEIIS